MAIEVGTAYISILPSTSKLAPAIRKELGAVQRESEQGGEKSGKGYAKGFKSGIQNMRSGALAVGAGIGALAVSSVKLEQDFSKTMSVMGATADVPAKGLKDLSGLALKLGADTSFSANEAATAMLELAKGGLSAATIQAGALEGTLQLAAAGGTSLESAATIASNALNTFALEGKDMASVSAALAGGANASTASVESLGMALSQVGPGARNAGLDLNTTVGALAAFDNAGIKGSDAGTSLKTMLQRLTPQTAKAASTMEKLGLNFTDAEGNFIPLTEVAQQLKDNLSGLSESQRTTALSTIFGSDATRAATVLMNEGSKGLGRYIKATKDQGAAERSAKANMSGTAGALERLSGSWETFRLELGLKIAPAVQRVSDLLGGLFDTLGRNSGTVITVVGVLAALAGAILVANAALLVGTAATNAWSVATGIATAVGKLQLKNKLLIASAWAAETVLMGLNTAATIASTLATRGLGAAIRATPIGWIITGIGLVVAALVWFFTKTELGQKIVKVAWAGIKTAAAAVVDWFQNSALPVLKAVWNGIVAGAKFAWLVLKVIFVTWLTAWTLLWKGIKWAWSKTGAPLFKSIKSAATAVWKWLRDKVFKPIGDYFRLVALSMRAVYEQIILPAWNGLKSAGSAVWSWLKGKVFAPIGRGFKAMGEGLKWTYRSVIKPVWDGIKSAASAAWRWIKDKAFSPLKKGIDAIGDAFKGVKKVIGIAFAGIKAATAKPINFVIETVYTKGIKKTWDKVADSVGLDLRLPPISKIGGYAKGGVLPGYTPGRDVHEFYSPTGGRLSLSGGEAIMRPEFTRAVGGPAGVAALNARARKGQAFKNGGVFGGVKNFFGEALGRIKDLTGSFLSGPSNLIKKIITGPMNSALAGMGGGTIGKVAAQLPKKVVGSLIDKAKGFASSMVPGLTGGGRPIGRGMGWQNMWRTVSAAWPGANLHSAFRPGAITAVGTPSMHGLGRAIDITPSMEIFNWLSKHFPNSNELIFSPANGRQIYKGRRMTFGEPTRGDHWDHIHWSMFNGGVIPKLYDQGGILPHGGLAINKSGKPEGILTNAESRALKAGGSIVNARKYGQAGSDRLQPKRYEMVITNWKTGEGYMREIAEDTVSSDAAFDGTVRRMR